MTRSMSLVYHCFLRGLDQPLYSGSLNTNRSTVFFRLLTHSRWKSLVRSLSQEHPTGVPPVLNPELCTHLI